MLIFSSHARDILSKYHRKIGGPPKPPTKPARTGPKSGKKSRSSQSIRRQSSTTDTDSPPPQKRQRHEINEDDEGDEGDEGEGTWVPRDENWETQIVGVETLERDNNGQLIAYIVFTNGKKTKVSMDKVYRHCPRPMLRFYEHHLYVEEP